MGNRSAAQSLEPTIVCKACDAIKAGGQGLSVRISCQLRLERGVG
jgi:hypothetical protein